MLNACQVFLGAADVVGCWRCYTMLAMLGMLFDTVWVLRIFLDVGDVFGCEGCFWVLGMFLGVWDVFGC